MFYGLAGHFRRRQARYKDVKLSEAKVARTFFLKVASSFVECFNRCSQASLLITLSAPKEVKLFTKILAVAGGSG